MQNSDLKRIAIVGGGAAGMLAAGTALQYGASVTIFEKNAILGKKLLITGKGRCNVTNACEVEGLFANVMEHEKFLYSAIYGFDNQAVMQFFEAAGCKLKIERGQRVFPESDHSSDVIRALDMQLKSAGVNLLLNREVESVLTKELEVKEEDQEHIPDKYKKKKSSKSKKKQTAVVTGVKLKNKQVIPADSVIVATGGVSYVLTGSTGDGHRFAKECGHSIVELSPALVPFQIAEDWCKDLQGLSLRNVEAVVEVEGKKIYSDFGEMLFTHYGVSGPLMLSASSYYVHKAKGKQAKIYIDLKPALTKEQLDKRILREFDDNKNKQFKNAITSLFPAK